MLNKETEILKSQKRGILMGLSYEGGEWVASRNVISHLTCKVRGTDI